MTWIATVEIEGDKLFARCEYNHPNLIRLPSGRKPYYCKTCGALFVADRCNRRFICTNRRDSEAIHGPGRECCTVYHSDAQG